MTIGKDSSKPSYGSTTPLAIPVSAANAETVTFDDEQRESSALLAVKVEELHEDDEFRPLYQDKWWAVAFLMHLAIVICLGVMFGSFGIDSAALSNLNVTAVVEDERDINEADIQKLKDFSKQVEEWIEIYPQRILACLILPGIAVAFAITYIWTAFILRSCPKAMVTACLLGSVVWTILITVSISIASQSILSYIGSAFMLGIVTYYVCIVWKLIPFAAVNLNVSLKAISRNWGMYLVALLFSIVSFVWTVFWLYTTIGLLGYETAEENSKQHPSAGAKTTRPSSKSSSYESDDFEEGGPQGITLVLLLISLYWTATVLLNTVQVSVAGVMGTYCYDIQDASSCCSPAVTSSLQRSLSYSFGSICFGSLLQALITVLRIMVENARNQQRQNNENNACGAILLCILECIVRLLEDIIDYFNQWAYVYVGIYGYSYLESGKKVIELFRARGWTSLVTNNLVGYVLGFSTFTVAIVTGLLTMVLENATNQRHGGESYVLGPISGHGWISFGLGFVIGIVVSSVMMNVIQGAVNTLIVCFADDPGKLEENHPKDARLVAESWISVFPDSGVRVSQYSVDV